MNATELMHTARAMVAKGKGILAADESTGTITKRFDGIKLESTEEHRRAYRELLFTAPAAAESISGVILYDETIRQKTQDGMPFPAVPDEAAASSRASRSIPAPSRWRGFPGETITEGLDGLRERLVEYRKLGARFAKWRAVIDIGAAASRRATPSRPTPQALARYAALCQETRASSRSSSRKCSWTATTRSSAARRSPTRCSRRCSDQLFEARVLLEGIVLKPNMVISGKKAPQRAGPEVVAEATLRCCSRHVPPAVPGIAFLSGGQSPQEATLHLALMNRIGAAALGADLQLRACAAGCGAQGLGRRRRQRRRRAARVQQARRLNGLAAQRPLHRGNGEPGRLRFRAALANRVSVPSTQNPRPGTATDAVVDVRDVHYAVGGRPIFAGLDLTVRRGRITAIMGP